MVLQYNQLYFSVVFCAGQKAVTRLQYHCRLNNNCCSEKSGVCFHGRDYARDVCGPDACGGREDVQSDSDRRCVTAQVQRSHAGQNR